MQNKDLYKLIYNTPSKKTGRDVDYAVRVFGSTVYLLFKGTKGTTDILTDINFPAKLYKNQQSEFYAHRGFGDAWKSANDIIMREFITTVYSNPTCNVCIAGHSLGGAMALLAAEDFNFRTGHVADVITFGCPRVLFGNVSVDHFKRSINCIKQYEIRNDPIPSVPPLFRHVNSVKVGEAFNIFKMLKDSKHYHCLYGSINF